MYYNHAGGVEWFGGWPANSVRWAAYTDCHSGNQSCNYMEEQPHSGTDCVSCGRVWVEMRGPGFMFTFIETYSISSGAVKQDGGSFYGESARCSARIHASPQGATLVFQARALISSAAYVLNPTQRRRLDQCALGKSSAAMGGHASAAKKDAADDAARPPLVEIGADCRPINRLPFVSTDVHSNNHSSTRVG